jgi:hypothetical protein
MTFYAAKFETRPEDERYKGWLKNFGISVNRNEDALLIPKDYDLKEGLPDWQKINRSQKEFVSYDRPSLFPYVGTYKGFGST